MDNMEKLTGQVMANETASAIYASLGAHINPAILADNYLQSKLSGNDAECLAIELHLRQAAQIHFHRPEALTALKNMERHKARRKMGKNAPKMLQEIGAQIRTMYAAGDYQAVGDKIVFMIRAGKPGNFLTVRCKDLPGAVELVACKYERGLPARSWRR